MFFYLVRAKRSSLILSLSKDFEKLKVDKLMQFEVVKLHFHMKLLSSQN